MGSNIGIKKVISVKGNKNIVTKGTMMILFIIVKRLI